MENFPEMQQKLTSINKKAISINDELEVFAKEIKFNNGVEFKLNDYETDLFTIPKKVKGIYFFEIKKSDSSLSFNVWIDKFREKWDIDHVRNRPTLRKKSLSNLLGYSEEWIPFYIGKSNNIQNRVGQHISLENTSTYALKLITMGNLTNEIFRLSYINIDTEHYDLVMPKIEQVLRDKYHPIIGKQ